MSSWKYRLAAAPVRLLDGLGLYPRPTAPVAYVVERANWSIRWDGTSICREACKLVPGVAEVLDQPQTLARRVVHFGSQFQWASWADVLPRSNRFVVTYFHGKPEDDDEMARHVEAFMTLAPRAARIVTAASLVEQRLLSWGIPRAQLVRIPIGVDLQHFRPATPEQRAAARARYGIAERHLVIGSFQKDGVGWGEGDTPKHIKGPDVLLDVVAAVAKERPVFVLLTGPARGFVKKGLERIGVPYAHEFVDDYLAIAERYAALDVYLNPSREEGGPKGILEGMASGIPVVSTRVGMAPDLIRDGENGFLAEPGDAARLAQAILGLDGRPADLVARARETVAAVDWPIVGRRHLEEVWQPLIEMQAAR